MAVHRVNLINNLLDNQEQHVRRPRAYRRKLDPLAVYTENEIRARYRFGRDGIQYIVSLVKDEISPLTKRSHAVSGLMQVLITLRFLASEASSKLSAIPSCPLTKVLLAE